MTRNLHVIIDDKFDPSPIFEATNTVNTYIFVLRKPGDKVRYLNKDLVKGMYYDDIMSVLKEGDYDNVFFHPLREYWYELVLAVPKGKKIIWCVFGVELYSNPYLSSFMSKRMNMYLPYTQKWIVENTYKPPFKLKRFVKNLIKSPFLKWNFYRAMKRIDYVAPIYKNEMNILSQIKGFHAKYFPFQYSRWSEKEDFGWKNNDKKFYILVAHSGYPINNHLDLLHTLIDRKIVDYDLYVPVAYGDEGYIDMLRSTMEEMPFHYVLQEKMIPYQEYQEIMKSCKVVIMPSIRQQASDTIYMNLLQGAKVYLYEKSMAYQYLSMEGIKVFSIERDLTSATITQELPDEIKRSNRKKVLDLVSIEKTIERVRIALDDI